MCRNNNKQGDEVMKPYTSELLGAAVYPEHKTICFYGGIFSQWAACEYDIKIGDKVERVNCAEQAMMLYKAHFHNDQEQYDKILASPKPWQQKKFGREIKNFNKEEWEKVALKFVVQSNIAKFDQNKAWKELLFLTDPYKIVEASKEDRIWGIGYLPYDVEIFEEKDKWGTNLLGIAIMCARNILMGYGSDTRYKMVLKG